MELGKDQATNTDVGYEIPSWHKWTPLAKFYHPLQAGSIDGTDTTPHDKAVSRATLSKYKPNKRVSGEPHKSLFVGKLSKETTEEAVFKVFSKCGDLVECRLVRDVVTGFSKGYAFVEYRSERDATTAWRELHKEDIDGNTILVEYEAARTLKGWIPRRLGGGFGGKKESGQLRFGGRDRPFRRPIPIQQTGNQQKHLRGSQDHENDRPERENYREGERFRVKFSDNYRENYGNRERERDKRSRENYSERERETSRSYREREESNDGSRYRERDSERSRDNDRERDVNRERDESNDGSRYRERDSERSRAHDREHGGDRYKNRERYKDNEGSRSKGSHGHRERRRESRDSRDKRKESDHRREPEDNERL